MQELTIQKIIVARNVTFSEEIFPQVSILKWQNYFHNRKHAFLSIK